MASKEKYSSSQLQVCISRKCKDRQVKKIFKTQDVRAKREELILTTHSRWKNRLKSWDVEIKLCTVFGQMVANEKVEWRIWIETQWDAIASVMNPLVFG